MVLKQFTETTMMEFDRHGELIYEGGYEITEEGRFYRNGEGTEYDGGRKVIYKGQYKHNQREGLGKEYEDGIFTKDYEKEKVVVLVEEGYWSIQVIGRRMKRLILM
ncbi:hypothetical protein JH06_3285 [Blastocystis sp. subtype 4]|uniref:hypothetical protein n=1 Tax=Blastocystis sp. subtype 4 TaxID=944170 RepID=UPI000711EE47|nr:hypothetical protein JH06_3285 [Blastocystis sp. subtype 4]KNB45935.1 hypothetical protein JH06_3285 [Blastocystis sp. subtype 4]|eukprot:XP_014529400.1 hypothetical protein JH06_3285 [Blastocystis sp. subtype 4]